MSIFRKPSKAKLVISIILNNKKLFYEVIEALRNSFGEIDRATPWLDFNNTKYYKKEMGSPLFRRVVSFEKRINQTSLADIKHRTAEIEEIYKKAGNRDVNIDPGYLLLERFILATAKNYSHRVYIGKSVYADVTLIYKNKKYQSLDWTYPDYKEKEINDFLAIVRETIISF